MSKLLFKNIPRDGFEPDNGSNERPSNPTPPRYGMPGYDGMSGGDPNNNTDNRYSSGAPGTAPAGNGSPGTGNGLPVSNNYNDRPSMIALGGRRDERAYNEPDPGYGGYPGSGDDQYNRASCPTPRRRRDDEAYHESMNSGYADNRASSPTPRRRRDGETFNSGVNSSYCDNRASSPTPRRRRDGGAPPPPPVNSYGTPPPPVNGYGSPPPPPVNNYGTPPKPPMNGYGTPPPPPVNNYGTPPKPPMNGYGTPPAPPPVNNYGTPPKPPVNGYGSSPSMPIMNGGNKPGPVPFMEKTIIAAPVPVKKTDNEPTIIPDTNEKAGAADGASVKAGQEAWQTPENSNKAQSIRSALAPAGTLNPGNTAPGAEEGAGGRDGSFEENGPAIVLTGSLSRSNALRPEKSAVDAGRPVNENEPAAELAGSLVPGGSAKAGEPVITPAEIPGAGFEDEKNGAAVTEDRPVMKRGSALMPAGSLSREQK